MTCPPPPNIKAILFVGMDCDIPNMSQWWHFRIDQPEIFFPHTYVHQVESNEIKILFTLLFACCYPSAQKACGVLRSSASVCLSTHSFRYHNILSTHSWRKVISYLIMLFGVAWKPRIYFGRRQCMISSIHRCRIRMVVCYLIMPLGWPRSLSKGTDFFWWKSGKNLEICWKTSTHYLVNA